MRVRAVLAGLWLGCAACTSDCYTLAQNICQCQPTPIAIQACDNNIAQQNSFANPSAADAARCTAQLQACDCRTLAAGTLQSKVTCGLARENPRDHALNP